MAASKTYLVAVDFSKGAEAALDLAMKMARENKGKLLLVHVLSAIFSFPLEVGFGDIFEAAEQDARRQMQRLVRRKRFNPGRYRFLLIRAADTALAIANQARRSRASMIIMGSHGRTGLQRLMLGSVAERTLRYARCPILIVKR